MRRLFLLIFFIWSTSIFAQEKIRIPILTYHHFDPSIPGSMTISPEKFESQMKWLKKNGYTFIPLKEAVDYLLGKRASLPPKPVVITADDGRASVYQYMLPLVKKYSIPVTLFIYPSPISRTSYALTWEQIKALQQTGLFDVESHTFFHPNFNQERKQLSNTAYQQLVHDQLIKSKTTLENKLGTKISLLAWPYGIYDPYLEKQAAMAGYAMAFSVDDRSAKKSENTMSMPRFVILDKYSTNTFIKFMTEM